MKGIVKIEDSSKIYFTSDMHVNHANIIKFCDRPYASKEEMTEALIHNWNETVYPNDTVYILGDFMWSSSWNQTLSQLNGKKILIWGNHDRKDFRESYLNYIDEVHDQLTLLIDNKIVYLNHFPFLCFPAGHIQLFGHVHLSLFKNEGSDFARCQNLLPNQYDVGVDLNNFTPVSWNTVKERIQYQIEHNTNCLHWIYGNKT